MCNNITIKGKLSINEKPANATRGTVEHSQCLGLNTQTL